MYGRLRALTLVRHVPEQVDTVAAMRWGRRVPARKREPKEFRRGKWRGLLREYGAPCPPRRGYQSHKQRSGPGSRREVQVFRLPAPKLPNQQCASGQSVLGRDGCSPQRGHACGSR
ncbi:uncharacterized protein LAJ45_01525 [Morchella importuna]|uniref:uncharacterized protein n=1 Tax=Morchella importuna TaxID=1174673 RepID=UPI001E8CE0B6|nr:uncharacterized protein LAJ45_01525 [Morchella importuna]KAH8154992.1 hypothetical protein LAJ45_01525 [Morchella importuna]